MLKFLIGLLLFFGGLEGVKFFLSAVSREKISSLLLFLDGSLIITAIAGVLITVLLQSSSAVSLLLISMLDSGLLKLKTAVVLMVGANLGTTVTIQFFSFSALLMSLHNIFLLAAMFCFAGKFISGRINFKICGLLFSLGGLFWGLELMGASFSIPWLRAFIFNLLSGIPGNGLPYFIIGVVITALIQSSSAVSGMIVALIQNRIFSLHQAFFTVLGSNIGTCITAFLAATNSGVLAKKLAIFHFLFNLLGVVWILPLSRILLRIISLTASTTVRQIANAHFLFNLLNLLFFIFLVYPLCLKKYGFLKII